jgi:predicted RNA-binding protein with PUA-like domain
MRAWLVKSEPSTYSFEDLRREGRTRWDGVRNAGALMHLRAMRKGDDVLFYHTGVEKRIVGLAKAASDPYPAPPGDDPRAVVVDLNPVRALATPVTLAAIKARREMAAFPLVRLGRLSVLPVSPAEWRTLLAMSD